MEPIVKIWQIWASFFLFFFPEKGPLYGSKIKFFVLPSDKKSHQIGILFEFAIKKKTHLSKISLFLVVKKPAKFVPKKAHTHIKVYLVDSLHMILFFYLHVLAKCLSLAITS